MTSSEVAKLVVAAAPHITHDHPMRDDFETVLRITGQVQLLPDYVEDNASSVAATAIVSFRFMTSRILKTT